MFPCLIEKLNNDAFSGQGEIESINAGMFSKTMLHKEENPLIIECGCGKQDMMGLSSPFVYATFFYKYSEKEIAKSKVYNHKDNLCNAKC